MQLKDIKRMVRQLLQDQQYDGDTIMQAANWFVYELANNNRLRIFEDSTELAGSQGDTLIAFPDDSLAWTGIWKTVPQVADFGDMFTQYTDFMAQNSNFASAAQAAAGRWTMFGNAMRLSAPLNADHTFQFDYVREPKEMKNDSSRCEIPSRYSEMIARGAKARILEIEEDYELASQERDILEPLVTSFVRNESRGGGKTRPTVIRSGRTRRNMSGIPRLGE